MGPDPTPDPMADFSNSLPDPLEAARRRHGFATPEDLKALDQLLSLIARDGSQARLRLGDRGGQWFESAGGPLTPPIRERRLGLEGTDVEGLLQVSGPVPDQVLGAVAELIQEVLRLRRLVAERRRQPRGPEGASFVPGVVHELRNFLFAMGAGLDAFTARFSGEGEEAVHGEALRRNLTRLQGFLEELQEYGNPGVLVFASVAALPVLAQSLRLAEPLASSRGVSLALRFPEADPTERMDRGALEGALRRLVEVAVLETQSGGGVEVVAQMAEGPGRPWLEATFTARPIRARDLDPERLFEPFYYRDKEMSRLGPAIARRVIEAHGGQLAAVPEADGLMLRVLLPVWLPGAGEAAP